MSENTTVHNVLTPILSVQTNKEFDELLERYKVKNPEKYAQKLASGDFDKFRRGLKSSKEEPKPEPKEEEKKEEKPEVKEPKEKKPEKEDKKEKHK